MFKKGCLFGCLTLVLLLGSLGVAGYRMASWSPPPAARPPAPTAQQAAATQRKIRALDAGLKAAAAGPAAGGPGGSARPRFRLQLDAADLNALWFANPGAQQQVARAGFRDPRVEFGDGTVALSGFAHALGGEIFIQLAGAPIVTPEGWLGLRIDDVRVGQLPAPARLREALTTQLQAPLREWSRELGARLDGAAVRSGRLVLEGTLRSPSRR